MKTFQRMTRKTGILIVLGVIVVLAIGKSFFEPLVLAALLSIVLSPLVRWLNAKGIPNALAVMASTIAALLVVGIIGWSIAGQVEGLLAEIPKYKENLVKRMDSFRHLPAGALANAASAISGTDLGGAPPAPGHADGEPAAHPASRDRAVRPGTTSTASAQPSAQAEAPAMTWGSYVALAETALAPFATAAAVLLFAIFMLLQRDDLHDRFIMLSGSMAGKHNMRRSAEALTETFAKIGLYIFMQLSTNILTGVVLGLVLWAVGLPNPLLWGLLAAMMRFIPYLGMVMAALLTTTFAVAISPDWSMPMIVLGLFAGIELVVSNVIEPLLYGHGTGLSSLAILVAAAFWTFLWGLPGLFLSVPLTVCLVMIGKHVPFLDFLETLLSDRDSLPKDSLMYHRLLSMQDGGMQTEIDRLCQGQSRGKALDTVYLPTLRIAEQELLFERLTHERFAGLLQNMRIAVEDLAGSEPANPPPGPPAEVASPAPAPAQKILCIGALGELDQMMAAMILRLADPAKATMAELPASTIAEGIAAIAREPVTTVIVASASDTSTMTAISWCRSLRFAFPDLTIIACAWDSDTHAENRLELVHRRRKVVICRSIVELQELLSPAVASAA
ncbi:MAG: AI-2E family transporter [Planctomycetes bacterium]|nr:AI-2E family transporter [Planctomycetota bacterium]